MAKTIPHMMHNPKGLSFLLSIVIALASAIAIRLLTGGLAVNVLLTIFFMIWILSFLLIYGVLDRLIFRDLKKLQDRMRDPRLHSDREIANEDVLQSPLRKISGDIDRLIAEKQNEIDRLKKVEAFRKDFIADVSHELKTPIFAAQGFVHTLLDGAVKEKAVRRKFLKKAAKSLDGLDMLVQDLLTLSQIETGQIKMRFQEIDLYSLTEEVFEQFKDRISKREITLHIDGPVRKVFAYADAQRIGQVMTNFISNAVKHSEEGGEVVVSFTVRKKSVVTRIKDSGEGIPAEHINRIFERFYRVDKSRSREKGGTGLGLAIVKHILDGHNSKAEVESIPGKGSTFSFKLPRARKEEEYGTSGHQESAKE